ncbi:MAG: hypothetical protein H6824_21590 [Planctomycetaceae bacterium]|nr:hypothetical protein [Planctomycetaceae bacterium]
MSYAEIDWKTKFGTLQHHDLLHSLNAQIESDRIFWEAEEDPPSLAIIVANNCRYLSNVVDEIVGDLNRYIWSHLDSRKLEFLRLGELVDRLLHPTPAFQELIAEPQTGHRISARPNLEVESEYDPWGASGSETRASAPSRSTPWRLPRQPLVSSHPDEAWWDEFVIRARGCGMSEAVARSQSLLVEAACTNERTAICGLVDAIDHAVIDSYSELANQVLSDHESGQAAVDASTNSVTSHFPVSEVATSESVSASCFGLVFREREMSIENSETGRTITVNSSLTFGILEVLANRGQRPTFKRDLEDLWRDFSGHDAPQSRSGISNRINKAKAEISKLGFTIISEGKLKDLRWRIKKSDS